ncbi:MAG: hypothetical protein OHK0022_07320 [Roseiflexaceae bacterium]
MKVWTKARVLSHLPFQQIEQHLVKCLVGVLAVFGQCSGDPTERAEDRDGEIVLGPTGQRVGPTT